MLNVRAFLALFLALCWTFGGCAPKQVQFVGPGHDFDWPVEDPDAPTYQAFLRAKRLSAEGNIEEAIVELNKALRADKRSPYLHFSLAVEYAKKNDLPKAEKMARRTVELDPGFRNAYYLLGKVCSATGKWGDSEKAFLKVIELDGAESNEGAIALATLYAESKRPEKAVGVLQALIEKEPRDLLARYYLGRIYTEMNEMGNALKTYRSAADINPSFTAPLKAIALIHEYLGSQDKAIATFQEVLEMEPDNVDIRNHLGQIYLEQENFEAAQAEYEEVIQITPNDVTAQLRLGLIYLRKEDFHSAERTFSRVLKNAPDLAPVRYYLAITRERLGKNSEAIKLLHGITPEASVYVDSCLALAFLYEKEGKREKAIKVLKRALARKKDSSELRARLASLWVAQKKFSSAVNVLEEGLERNPKDETLWISLAEVNDKKGSFDNVVSSLRKALELNPDNAGALNYLGYLFAEKGKNLEEAEQLIRRALEMKPKDGYITDSLGWVYYQQGNYEKAIEKLQEAMTLAPNEPVILEHYGDVLVKVGRETEAKGYYKQALGLFRESDERKRVEKKIKNLSKS